MCDAPQTHYWVFFFFCFMKIRYHEMYLQGKQIVERPPLWKFQSYRSNLWKILILIPGLRPAYFTFRSCLQVRKVLSAHSYRHQSHCTVTLRAFQAKKWLFIRYVRNVWQRSIVGHWKQVLTRPSYSSISSRSTETHILCMVVSILIFQQ